MATLGNKHRKGGKGAQFSPVSGAGKDRIHQNETGMKMEERKQVGGGLFCSLQAMNSPKARMKTLYPEPYMALCICTLFKFTRTRNDDGLLPGCGLPLTVTI